jgi:PAS domain S-box-containing protein
MSTRFLDKSFLRDTNNGFKPRRRGLPLAWVTLVFSLVFITLVGTISLVVPEKLLALGSISAVLFLGLGIWIAKVIDEYQSVLLLTEFQNSLFAGAARQGNEFCVILKRDGAVAYVDPEFMQRFLPGSRQILHMGAIWNALNLDERDRVSLSESVLEGRQEMRDVVLAHNIDERQQFSLSLAPIEIWNERAGERSLLLSIDPITRPSGYLLLRARRDVAFRGYEELFDRFEISYAAFDSDGRCLTMNNSAAHAFGYKDPTGFLEKNHHLSSLFSHKRQYDTLYQIKQSWSGALEWLRPDSSKLKCYCLVMAHRDAFGALMQQQFLFFNSAVAVENSNFEAAENNKSERLSQMMNHSPLPTAVLDERGHVVSANQPFCQITEHAADDVHGWDFLASLRGDDRAAVEDIFKKAAAFEAMRPLGITLHAAKDLHAAMFVNRLPRRNNAPARFLVHLIDTTEQKKLEMRFVHSQKMQAVGQLAGGVAHDFNNLLTAMIGFCDLLLLRHPAGDQSFADIMQIKQNANRAANLVRQLLAFSRKQTLQPVVLNVTDVLADVSNLVRRLIGESIELKMVHGRELGLIRADQGQLEQVIVNLAVNARDAMDGNGMLTLRTHNITINQRSRLEPELIPPSEDDTIPYGQYVRIDVIDNGSGIPKSIIGKIFEPFFSTKEIGSGTGLGLATVYGIIKQTDGYIYVASTEGKGTMFSLFLKRYQASEEELLAKSAENSERDTVDLTGKGSILLVEDEDAVRLFSASALRNKGYTVFDADSAEKALTLLAEHSSTIDLVITDVVMPGMTGPAMVEEIIKTHPLLKVIFISGYAEDAFRDTYGASRQFHFLPKPYSLKQLAGKVKDVLQS